MEHRKYTSTTNVQKSKSKRREGDYKFRLEYRLLESRISELRKKYAELEEQANRDPLTGVYNRRRMESILTLDSAQVNPVSVIMLDMDNLKAINDIHGHIAGDLALKVLGEKLKRMTRAEDIVCRYGGDEFIVFLQNVNLQTARKRAEEWRRSIERNPVAFQTSQIQITVTAGVANYTEHGNNLSQVIEEADKALYWAKAMGRNRVATANDTRQTILNMQLCGSILEPHQ
jgi:diguanylate cyclase